jgi:hypothetical protein
MGADLPDYYFRVRENGAAVYRVDCENRQRRIELEQIAVVNVNNGQIRPHGGHVLSEADLAAIRDWRERRLAVLARRDMDDIHRAIDHMNLTAHWAQTRATEAQLEEVTDALLLAMHDLRSVLVRRKAERLTKGQTDAAE